MIDEANSFALECRDGSGLRPVLTGVDASARLDGVLFELTLRQTYRNHSAKVLEVIYTFPLPHQAVMLGFATELNGERMAGTIVAKQHAERQYEEALAEGDAPVMASGSGLHTANIGNLKPGEEIVLEVRFGQLLRFEQGRLRIAIPTTIAPRYGNAAQAGLQPQQAPKASLTAEYPLTLSVVVANSVGASSVECPSHPVSVSAVEGGRRLVFASSAWLDRDVVIVVTPSEPRPSLLIQAHDAVSDDAPTVMLAALQPPLAAQCERVAVKLLVDCSGSMGGDSIASARRALHGVLQNLHEQDWVSLSRFGSSLEHVLAPTPCTTGTLRYVRPLVDLTEASLGGTSTGGACEFATPGEALEAAAQRMLARIRQQAWRDVRIDWGSPTIWHSPLPCGVFAGDTVIEFGGTAARDSNATVRLLALDPAGNPTELARSEASAPAAEDSLPRIAAAGRLGTADESDAISLALS